MLEKSVIADYNTKLASRATSWAAAHSGANARVYDSNTKVTDILNNPSKYGFVDATSYGDVSKDVWCEYCPCLVPMINGLYGCGIVILMT